MTYLVLRGEVPDYETWKRDFFDADPVGRKQAAKGRRIYRGVNNPNQIILQGEFSSPKEARSFRERLLASGVIDRAGAKLGDDPIVVEEAEAITY